MSTFEDRILLTPFGLATCWERIDLPDTSFWICWMHETSICFWFNNQEVRAATDWSLGRYSPMPFRLASDRIQAMQPLGAQHSYWRDHVALAVSRPPQGDAT